MNHDTELRKIAAKCQALLLEQPNAERKAALRSTISAIDLLLDMMRRNHDIETAGKANKMMNQIIEAWKGLTS